MKETYQYEKSRVWVYVHFPIILVRKSPIFSPFATSLLPLPCQLDLPHFFFLFFFPLFLSFLCFSFLLSSFSSSDLPLLCSSFSLFPLCWIFFLFPLPLLFFMAPPPKILPSFFGFPPKTLVSKSPLNPKKIPFYTKKKRKRKSKTIFDGCRGALQVACLEGDALAWYYYEESRRTFSRVVGISKNFVGALSLMLVGKHDGATSSTLADIIGG